MVTRPPHAARRTAGCGGGSIRALAVDYGPHGIRTNAVALGSIDTELHAALLAAQPTDRAGRIEADLNLLHPRGRIGYPYEAAATVAFLLSDQASFINGAVVPVDGGRAAYGPDPEQR